MPLEDLPNGFVVPSRADIRDKYQRDVGLRQPGAPTGEGSQAFIDGSALADALMPLYADAASIGKGANIADMTRAQLKAECKALGIPEELPESAGSGFVDITASAGGVFIDTSKELKDDARGLRFRCAVADTYYDTRAVPIIGIDKGPTTNLPAASVLKWSNPPPGLGSLATVLADANGDGLTGGREAESDDDIRRRISSTRADPSAGGNVAQIRKIVKDAGRDLGIAVQDVFVYPAITGSGHYCYVFTLRPGKPGSSRVPDPIQIAAVRAFLARAMPEDDGIFSGEIIEQNVTAKLGIRWASTAVGWVDAQPWPDFGSLFAVTTVTSPIAFNVAKGAATWTAPTVGKTFAFFDRANGKFVRKKILSVTDLGAGVYTLAIDDTNNASDVNYLPVPGEEFCPYSPSLDLLVAPLLSRIDLLGPGEQLAAFFDEGYRQRRQPPDPVEWPMSIRHKDLDDVEALQQVNDASWLAPTIPYAASVGVAGASSNILVINKLFAFPI